MASGLPPMSSFGHRPGQVSGGTTLIINILDHITYSKRLGNHWANTQRISATGLLTTNRKSSRISKYNRYTQQQNIVFYQSIIP